MRREIPPPPPPQSDEPIRIGSWGAFGPVILAAIVMVVMAFVIAGKVFH